MKTKFHSIAILGSLLLATSLHADPTPTPTPTPAATPAVGSVYLDGAQPMPARIADARAVIAAPGTDDNTVAAATSVLDSLSLWQVMQPADWQATGHALAAQIIAAHGQMTPAMTPAQSFDLLWKAVHCTETYGYTAWKDRADYLRSVVTGFTGSEPADYVTGVKGLLAWDCAGAAWDFVGQSDYADALQQISDPALLTTDSCYRITSETAKIKTLTRSSDALSWAKAAYLLAPFDASQDGVNIVTGALRAADLNLTRANVFIAAQADATQANILASTTLPTVFASGPLPEPQYAVVNALLKGDDVGALRKAQAAYLAAPDNAALNAAVAQIAQTLRDVDLDLVRANAYVAAQKAGTTYDIAELH